MTTRDYTKEIGNRAVSPRVPMPVAIALLAIGGAGLWFAVEKVRSLPSARRSVEETATVAAKPAAHAHASQR